MQPAFVKSIYFCDNFIAKILLNLSLHTTTYLPTQLFNLNSANITETLLLASLHSFNLHTRMFNTITSHLGLLLALSWNLQQSASFQRH